MAEARPGRARRPTAPRDHDYDVVVIGSGAGAFAPAIRARDLGAVC